VCSVRVSSLLRPFIGIGVLAWAGSALAEPVSVTNDELKTLVTGSLVEIDTPLGTKIPVRFGNDGLVSGQALDLAPLLGAEKDRGRWWVDGEKLCSKWFRWFDAEVRCITVQQDGDRLFWRKDDGETGTATLVERGAPEKSAPPQASSTVVADAKASPSVSPSAGKSSEDGIPLPARKPAHPKIFVAADAGDLPRRETAMTAAPSARAAEDAPQANVSSPGAQPAPTEVALKEEEPAREAPVMRFGGSGLLEASSRVGSDPASPAPSAPASNPTAPPHAPPVRSSATSGQTVAALPLAPAHAAPRSAKGQAAVKAAGHSQKQAAPTATSALPAYYRVRGVDANDVLNVRRGPSDGHASIAAIPPSGRRVRITGPCEQVWCPVQYGRIKGWVNSLYLAEEVPQASSASQVYTAKR